MKVFVSSDMEGTCGIAAWCETDKGKDLYEHFRRQMSLECAAACEGAISAGATEILVKDAHDSARNIDPTLLPEQAKIFRGWGKSPFSMMAGIDESFDGVIFTGYHSAAQMATNPLSHTMNTQNVYVKLNDELCPELMINSLIASYFKVPVYCVTGDKGLCEWMNAHCPGTSTVAVNEGVGAGCVSIHPSMAIKRIRQTAETSFKADREKCLFPMPKFFKAEVSFKEHTKALAACWYPGCVKTGARTVSYESADYMDILRFFFWVL